jgi:prepilin-type N-terminal cleavage/methylation domain-containing protein
MQTIMRRFGISAALAGDPRAGRRPAFTLVEILFVVLIISILAAVVIPRMSQADTSARIAAMASMVRNVRTLISFHSSSGQFPLAPSGYPDAIAGDWWSGNRLPIHEWTAQQIVIETVDGAAGAIYPAGKTFDPSNALAANAWYNRTNGSFMIRVPDQGNDADTIALFNAVNVATITALGDTG